MKYDVLILGGGAAGLLSGVVLAQNGLRTAILEKGPRVGKKLAATGNGRCNLTNMNATAADFGPAAAFVRPAMQRFAPQDVIDVFESIGVVCEPDEAGRVYPMSNQASSVLDVLRAAYEENSGEEITDCCVDHLRKKGGLWQVHVSDGRIFSAGKVIYAMGGQAAPNLGGCPDGVRLLKDMGYKSKPCFPALTPVKCDHPRLKALKGIRAAGIAALMIDGKPVAQETGEILFQDYGLSGIAIMQLSGAAAQALSRQKKVEIRLNLCDTDRKNALGQLRRRRELLARRAQENFLTGYLNKRLGQTLLKMAGCEDMAVPSGDITDAHLSALADLMTGWTLPVTSTMGFAQAQVTRGGIDNAEFDPETLQSRRHPGLYAAGEVLDVDGPCGGYNLQWAWASALTACRHITENR